MRTPALEYWRSPARYLAARAAASTVLGRRVGGLAPLRLVDRDDPVPPGPGWVRLRPRISGICGSDLAMLGGQSSLYLSPLVSPPFVPGHEVVADMLDPAGDLPAGTRVVVDPVLGCAARGGPACRWCVAGRTSRCDRITTGRLSAGLQTGFCADTGGGWGRVMVAHASQLHPVPDDLDDERAVLVEPLACAVHAVRRAEVPSGASVVIVGAGTVGLLTLLALRACTNAGPVHVIGKHAHQRGRAARLGATETMRPKGAVRAMRRVAGGNLEYPELGGDFLLGGVDVAFECTGTAAGTDTTLRLVRAGGTVLLTGMPAGTVDLTPVWFRQLRLIGSYATDHTAPDTEHAGEFAEAIDLVGHAGLAGFVNEIYPLSRWRDAIRHAGHAGRLGAVKIAFGPDLN